MRFNRHLARIYHTVDDWRAAALSEAQELKKRKYHLTKWPHADLADKIIEAIASD